MKITKTRNLTHKCILALVILSLSGCGLLNQQAGVLHMIKTGLTPNKYKVKRTGESSFPENGSGIISLNFTTGSLSSSDSGVNTAWRKINDDGTFSSRIYFYSNIFKTEKREEYMFEPGVYFLDGFSFLLEGRGFVRSGALLNILSTKQHGWNEVKKQPKWFSFVVEKGKEIKIPDIIVSARCKSGASSCDGSDFIILIKTSNAKSENYKTGYEVELAK